MSEIQDVKAGWRGTLSIEPNGLTGGISSTTFHLRAGKAQGDLPKISIIKVDKETGREVVMKDVAQIDVQTQLFGQAPVAQAAPAYFAKTVRKPFFKDEADLGNFSNPLTLDRVTDKSILEGGESEEVEPFDRTTAIEVGKDGFISLDRLSEYKFKEVYMLGADTDKKVKEDPTRITSLARFLLDKQSGMVSFFSWGRGYAYYTAVIYPYERKQDGKLWLLMGLTEGFLTLSEKWSLQEKVATPVISADPIKLVLPKKKKPTVQISK